MRISKFGTQRVHPLTFWVVLGVLALLMGAMNLYGRQIARLPSHWFAAAVLALIWGTVLWDTARRGRRALPLWRMAFLLGATLSLGGTLVPSLWWASRVGNLGGLLMLAVLWPWVEFGKRTKLPPADAPPHEVSG